MPKRRNELPYSFGDPYYRVHYAVFGCDPRAFPMVGKRALPVELHTALAETGFYDRAGTSGHFRLACGEKGTAGLMWVSPHLTPGERRLVAAHETLHATFQVLTRVGVNLSGASEEAFTYYHSWLTEQVWKALGV